MSRFVPFVSVQIPGSSMFILQNYFLVHPSIWHHRYCHKARENEAREHIPVPYDNLFQSIFVFAPRCEKYI